MQKSTVSKCLGGLFRSVLFKFSVDCKRFDKLEFRCRVASACEPKFEPRQGWHNAWREIPHCFKIPPTQKKHAPTTARSSASLRSSPLAVALRCVAIAPSHRAQFSFFTFPGVPRLPSPLLRSSAEADCRSTPGYYLPPLPGLKIRLACARKLQFIELCKNVRFKRNLRFILRQRFCR